MGRVTGEGEGEKDTDILADRQMLTLMLRQRCCPNEIVILSVIYLCLVNYIAVICLFVLFYGLNQCFLSVFTAFSRFLLLFL